MDTHCPAVHTKSGCTKVWCKKIHPYGYVTRCLKQQTARGCRTADCSFSHSQDPFSCSGSSDSGREKRGMKAKRREKDWEQEDLPAQKRARHSSVDVWGRLGNYDPTGQDRRSVGWNSAGWEEPYCGDWNERHGDRNNTEYSGKSDTSHDRKNDTSHTRKNDISHTRNNDTNQSWKNDTRHSWKNDTNPSWKNDTSESRKNDTGYSGSGTWDTSRCWSSDRSLQLGEASYPDVLQEVSLHHPHNLLMEKDKEIEKLKRENNTLLNQHDGSAKKKLEGVKRKLVTAQRETNEFKIKEDFSNFSLKYATKINDAEKLDLKRRLEKLINKSEEDKVMIEDLERNACFQSKQILILRAKLSSALENPPEKEKESLPIDSPGASLFLEGRNFRYLTSSPLQQSSSAMMETPKFNFPSNIGEISHMSHSSQQLDSPHTQCSSTFMSHRVDSPIYSFSSPHHLHLGQM